MAQLRTFSLLVLAATSVACSSEGGHADAENAPDLSQADHTVECDRSPYNCKVPNFESTPPNIPHDTNRAFNDFDNSYYWGLLGTPALRDGENGLRGYVAGDEGHPHEVKINFGERKDLGGVTHVYAFSALLTNGHDVSGWIPESSVKRHGTLAKMPTIEPKDPGTPFYEEDWVVTGGDLGGDHQTLALNAQYGDLRVNPNVTDAQHASDYLVRQWDPATRVGYVNFVYSLPHSGGVTADTLPMCVHFKRFKGVDELNSTLYFPGSTSTSKLELHFVYGQIDGRRGWMTHEMLTAAADLAKLDPSHPCNPSSPPPAHVDPGPAPSSTPDPGTGSNPNPNPNPNLNPNPNPTPNPDPTPAPATVACHVLCCQSGAGNGDFSVASSAACIDQAQTFCADNGHVQSASVDGNAAYTRDASTSDLRCWAKCHNRTDYHEVTGVTDDCAGHAKSYCDVGDRGGLADASWDRCNPN